MMITVYDLKILFYLTIILFSCLLPLYLFRRRWKEVAIIAGVIIYFFVLNKDFILGALGVYHDTRFSYEYILTIFKQWLDTGIPIGWNPYMNAGEPLYLFSNIFLWSPWVFFCRLNKFINLNSHILFNLFWTFLFVNFCAGSLLLFLVLYDDFKAALFSFVALIISGMFIINLGQAAGLSIMYYFPYVLFCIVLSCKRKNIYGIALSIIFLGIALNHYLPHYIILCVGIFVFFVLAFNLKLLPLGLRLLKSKYKIIFLALVISFLVASPALFLYFEMQNYISPTRGGALPGGAIELGQTGYQPNVNAPLWGYRVLLEQSINYRANIHHAFYFGIIPLLFMPLALFRWRNKYVWAILISAFVILFLSTGDDFWGYRLLIKYIPGFNMVRHSFGLAQFVSFFLICLAGYGLKELLRGDLSIIRNVKLTVLILISLVIMFLISHKFNVVLFGSLGALVLIIMLWIKQILFGKIRNFVVKPFYLLIMFLLFLDLTLFYRHYFYFNLLSEPTINLSDIVYPPNRTFYPSISCPIPPDLSPLIFKRASLTHPDDNLILFRHRRLNDMLKLFSPHRGYEQALGVNGPIIYFTSYVKIFPESTSKEQFIETIYNDSFRYSFTRERNVFFLEKDIDFYSTNNNGVPSECIIEYTKIDNPNEVEILVRAPKDGFLVRLENFHPNWQAFIDNKKTNIYRANYAFQAIRIPKGQHRVSFKFSTIYPTLFYIHIFCVFLIWFLFNFVFLRKIGRSKTVC